MKTKKNKKIVGFWEGETCEYCGGKLIEKEVDLLRKNHDRYYIFEKVPAAVCHECGTKYYSANIVKIMSEKVKLLRSSHRKQKVSLLDLKAA